MPAVLAIFAHPDDIEIFAAGTLLQLGARGWDLHYLNLSTGNGGSVEMDGEATEHVRLAEARQAAEFLGAAFYPPVSRDLEILYGVPLLRKVAAVVRRARPSIVLTHAPQDYMEDHMETSRLAVTATFAHGVPNFLTDPPEPSWGDDVAVYHAMPHGLCDPLRRPVAAEAWVDTTPVHERKRAALALHASQKNWLDVSQGADSYLIAMDAMSQEVGRQSGVFPHAEGWRRHLHLGMARQDADPLRTALGDAFRLNPDYSTRHFS